MMTQKRLAAPDSRAAGRRLQVLKSSTIFVSLRLGLKFRAWLVDPKAREPTSSVRAAFVGPPGAVGSALVPPTGVVVFASKKQPILPVSAR